MQQLNRVFWLLVATVSLLGLAFNCDTAFAQATITIVNDDDANEGLNDPTAVAAVGGNPEITLGAQRLFVLQTAANVWAAILKSDVEIIAVTTFDPAMDDFGDPDCGTLGSYGPNSFHRDFTGAPQAGTFFSQAQANAIVGTDLNPGMDDMTGDFNTLVDDQATCGAGSGWYNGIDNNVPEGKSDLFTTALHELAHGLGFLSLPDNETGEKFLGFDDIWNFFLYDTETGKLWKDMTDAERVTSSINDPDLVWGGPSNPNSAVTAKVGNFTAGTKAGFVRMYAPDPLEFGSTVSHFHQDLVPDELMEPADNTSTVPGLTVDLFIDMGWPMATPTTSVEDPVSTEKPESFGLFQNYPNPFNPSTSFSFQISKTSHVRIKIYNLLGREVRTLIDERKSAGTYGIGWDGKDDLGNGIGSGVYIYRMQAGNFIESRKMILLK